MSQSAQEIESNGFVGAVSGLSLADIIQVKGTNHYTGCLVVEHRGRSGMVYFREGEIVHAEQGNLSGEEAFYSIMEWVGGSFRSEPKLATTSRTIDQKLGFLILEALRHQDESTEQRRMVEAKEKEDLERAQHASTGSAGGGGVMSDITGKLKNIQGVDLAVIITKEGEVVDDTSYKAELLGGHSLYLSLFAGQIASQFGIGGLKSATVQGTQHHMLLFDSKRHYLCVMAEGSGQINSIESDIRRVLAEK